MQKMLASKCLARQRNAVQAATSCVSRRYAANTDSDALKKASAVETEKQPDKAASSKAPKKKRKYNVKRVLDDFNNLNIQALEPVEKAETKEPTPETRRNEVNIEMLPPALFQLVFGNDKKTEVSNKKLKLVKDHLKQHDLLDKVEPPLADLDLPLPKLQVTHNTSFHVVALKYKNFLRAKMLRSTSRILLNSSLCHTENWSINWWHPPFQRCLKVGRRSPAGPSTKKATLQSQCPSLTRTLWSLTLKSACSPVWGRR